MIAVETILTAGLGFLVLLWIGIRFRKGGRWFKEKGLFGFALVLIIVGTALLLIAFLTNKLEFLSLFADYIQANIKIGTILLVAGAVGIIIDQLYRTWKKEQKLGIEHERRRYIERVRFGLDVGDAEKIAKNHIKKVTGKTTKLVASKKEFKHWAVYLKDSDKNYYRIVINGDGKIEEWETMDEIPSYILSP